MPALAFVKWLAILATAGIGSAIAIFVWDRIQAGAWDFTVQSWTSSPEQEAPRFGGDMDPSDDQAGPEPVRIEDAS